MTKKILLIPTLLLSFTCIKLHAIDTEKEIAKINEKIDKIIDSIDKTFDAIKKFKFIYDSKFDENYTDLFNKRYKESRPGDAKWKEYTEILIKINQDKINIPAQAANAFKETEAQIEKLRQEKQNFQKK